MLVQFRYLEVDLLIRTATTVEPYVLEAQHDNVIHAVKSREGTMIVCGRKLSLIAGLGLVASAVTSAVAPSAWSHPKMPAPGVTCVEDGATQVSLKVKVCGDATVGAPAGFQLFWFKGDASDPFPTTAADGRCVSSFWSRAKGHFLAPGECIEVSMGELLAQESTRTTPGCAVPLQCGSSYAFKGIAKTVAPYKYSAFSPVAYCETLACTPPGESCTLTQGYWDNHGPVPSGNNEYTWPDSVKQAGGFSLGNIFYTNAQLQSILKQPTKGNGLVSLAHQLIAAKLNVANGADPTDVAPTIADADALIGALVVPPVGTGFLAPAATSTLNDALADYNEGKTGPGHCS